LDLAVSDTALLDAGIPVNRVAERIGDDPAILLGSYAKRKRTTRRQKPVGCNHVVDSGLPAAANAESVLNSVPVSIIEPLSA
jgi:hypothetical protein